MVVEVQPVSGNVIIAICLSHSEVLNVSVTKALTAHPVRETVVKMDVQEMEFVSKVNADALMDIWGMPVIKDLEIKHALVVIVVRASVMGHVRESSVSKAMRVPV